MTTIALSPSPHLDYLLGLADDALVLGHRLSEWIGHAPTLEEELALGNIGLDLIGQSRSLFTHAGSIEGQGRDEDVYAYRRDAPQFRNLHLVELPNGDFAFTIARLLLVSALTDPLWRALSHSRDETLGAIADKASKETAYHLRHAAQWLVRLGDGTAQSHRRCQDALDELWPFVPELFDPFPALAPLVEQGIAVDPASLRVEWDRTIDTVLAEATLTRPRDARIPTGGRIGVHTEYLGHLLSELQFVSRAYPDAKW